MNEIKNKVKVLAHEFYNEVVEIRRHLHQNPELSFEEFETSNYIKSKLKSWGIPYKDNFVKTGILGVIEGKPGGKTIALRADMDALPIKEENDVPYKSVCDGKMHACGHDVHMASLLGAAKILNELKDQFTGKILLIFQPGEELLPGGAKLMMEEGVFDQYKPAFIIAQHVMPELEAGKTGFRAGLYMASTDEIYLKITGKGGHAAMPHKLTDTVLITAHILVALQQIVSRNAFAAIPTVLSFGKVIANGATNIIPSEVNVAGTFRTMNETWRATAHEKIKKLAMSIAEGMGGRCEVEIKNGYPFLINDEALTVNMRDAAREFLGEEHVEALDLRMTSEDFAWFSQQYPSSMYRLGISPSGKENEYGLHNAKFNIDEKALETSIGTMAYMAIKILI